MKSSCCAFVLVVLLGLSVPVLAQAPVPAQGQFRRLPAAQVAPAAPRQSVVSQPFYTRPPAVMPYNTFTYVPQGLNRYQLAGLNALGIQNQLYLSQQYSFSPNMSPGLPFATPGMPYNSYNFYNPSFGSFVFYP